SSSREQFTCPSLVNERARRTMCPSALKISGPMLARSALRTLQWEGEGETPCGRQISSGLLKTEPSFASSQAPTRIAWCPSFPTQTLCCIESPATHPPNKRSSSQAAEAALLQGLQRQIANRLQRRGSPADQEHGKEVAAYPDSGRCSASHRNAASEQPRPNCG